MIVLDANILIRAVLGKRVRTILEKYETLASFHAPDTAFSEARRYFPALLEKRNIPVKPALVVFDSISAIVKVVEADIYGQYERSARQRISSRDEDDWPILATALAFRCPI